MPKKSKIDRRSVLAVLAMSSTTLRAQSPEHVRWVEAVLKRMETIKAGMTRETLLTVFTTEGGLSTVSHRTYVSRDCPYFKVDVDFEAAGKNEAPRDRIVKISRPYLQFSIVD
jgi:hypothetical protein